MSAGLSRCAVPVSIHCDHLIQASSGAHADLEVLIFCWSSWTTTDLRDRVLLSPTRRSLTSWRARPRSTELSSGSLGPVLSTRSSWKTTPPPGCLCVCPCILPMLLRSNFPLLRLGTDSHTPNASGLGMLAIGVGGADAVDAMTGTPWELKAPNVVGVCPCNEVLSFLIAITL